MGGALKLQYLHTTRLNKLQGLTPPLSRSTSIPFRKPRIRRQNHSYVQISLGLSTQARPGLSCRHQHAANFKHPWNSFLASVGPMGSSALFLRNGPSMEGRDKSQERAAEHVLESFRSGVFWEEFPEIDNYDPKKPTSGPATLPVYP